jgi:hypothetical protein
LTYAMSILPPTEVLKGYAVSAPFRIGRPRLVPLGDLT